MKTLSEVESHLTANNPHQAVIAIEKMKENRHNRVLYLLNAGIVYRYNQDFDSSIHAFEQAKAIIHQQEALSVSGLIGSLSVSEYSKAYEATNVETLSLYIFQMLNFMEIGDFESARVEALQLDAYLKRLADTDFYAAEAFARYLTGVVFQATGEKDNALIAYKKSLQHYEKHHLAVPLDLQRQLIRLSRQLGFKEDEEAFAEKFNIQDVTTKESGSSSLVIYHVGFIPKRLPNSIATVDPDSGLLYHVSVPKLIPRRLPQVSERVRLGPDSLSPELGFDLGHAMELQLDAQLPGLTAKAISRLVAAKVVVNKVDDETRALAHIINIASSIAQTADIRQWSLLPAELHLMRVDWPEGQAQGHRLYENLTYPGENNFHVQSFYLHNE